MDRVKTFNLFKYGLIWIHLKDPNLVYSLDSQLLYHYVNMSALGEGILDNSLYQSIIKKILSAINSH